MRDGVANYIKAENHDRKLLRLLRKAYPEAAKQSDNAAMKAFCAETGIGYRTAVKWFKESGLNPPMRFFVLHYLEYQAAWNS